MTGRVRAWAGELAGRRSTLYVVAGVTAALSWATFVAVLVKL